MQANQTKAQGAARAWVWTGAGLLLLLPAVAMRFTDEVNWTAADFVVAAILLAVPCGLWHVASVRHQDWAYRAGVALLAVGGLVLTWINLAVGLVGEPQHAANRWGFVVLLLGAAVAAIGRLRATALRYALWTMAVAQAAWGAYAWLVHHALEATVLCAAFSAWWCLASLCFAKASRAQA